MGIFIHLFSFKLKSKLAYFTHFAIQNTYHQVRTEAKIMKKAISQEQTQIQISDQATKVQQRKADKAIKPL